MPIKISHLTTKQGQTIKCGRLTILVGPNNSGKSQTLKDIRSHLTTGRTDVLKIFNDIACELPSPTDALIDTTRSSHPSPEHHNISGISVDLSNREMYAAHTPSFNAYLEKDDTPNRYKFMLENLGRFWIAHLDAERRFKLSEPTASYEEGREAPGNALQKFFALPSSQQEQLRDAFKSAFKMDIALDWTAMAKWYMKIGDGFGALTDDRIQRRDALQSGEDLHEQGDGFRSFAGVALSLLAFPNRLLLLDEPEAFLHPAQAYALGTWIARQASQREPQTIIATHNSNFLWGIVSASPETTIIRLNRTARGTRYDVVPPAATQGLVKSPMLSSQPILDAMFRRCAVLCEGDPDRAIYQTVAEKISEVHSSGEVLFVHTNGKGGMSGPLAHLRQAGTPVAAIVDFDVLNQASELERLLVAITGNAMDPALEVERAFIAGMVEQGGDESLIAHLASEVQELLASPPSELRQFRRRLNALADAASKWDAVKKKGIAFFDSATRPRVQQFLANLGALGLFLVPCGELESWIPSAGTKKGRTWNARALQLLHDQQCPNDLMDFVKRVLEYLRQ
ncbi:ATP-dependent nuclease [Burkholderia vietnamiensis]|uniref:ATP-dependent nuclease n=1 Tax=Burkholderia vietnamiensis TaxID=60552 RepID=UPI00158B4A27|nr:ATP-binding protein [Burkholderia vietnamiensis]